ncbi:DUF2249 domain-containing protein [Thalassobacillus pellis]|uniref:DUF2249 domain-containing protein n=1 Tax=Thalassobacillus pellis TaxID=748008 RepID=UPI00195F2C75|nr:DUF2249 domain-containing protein [Thalassobacillus pellis]MBM7554054.1 TusA-related sulfurtransferase [Thalassobacillus pellis]
MLLDNRGLQPPQPMMRTLTALEELETGDQLVIINDRRPMFLFAELDELGHHYETQEQSDGSFRITIRKSGG